MTTLLVREIMTSSVHTLAASASIEEAARVLTEARVGGAPVLDRGRIVGVVSKSDLVDPLHRRTSEAMTVADVMTHVIFAVRPSDPVMLAVRLMVAEGIHRAVVVDEGRVVGVITPMDVLRAVSRGASIEDSGAQAEEREATVRFVDLRELEVR